MAQELSVYGSMPDPMAFVKEMGAAIARSQMFGCENESQGQVIAMACLARRCDPMSIPQEYHLMHGRLTLRADAMLGRLSRAGGSYEIVEHSPEAAEIRVTYKGRSCRERFTWAEAQEEPFVYVGKASVVVPQLLSGDRSKLVLSGNYATPRRRMQHLWARVVSDAVRIVAPDLVTGGYTPEENEQIAIDDGKLPPAVVAVRGSAAQQPAATETAPAAAAAAAAEDTAEDAVIEHVATPEQIQALTGFFTALKTPPDKQLEAIQKVGARDMGDLSQEGAAKLIAFAQAKLAAQQKAEKEAAKGAATAGQATAASKTAAATAAAEPADTGAPCTPEQVNEVKDLIRRVAQVPAFANVAERVKSHLTSCGIEKIADLTSAEVARLIAGLTAKDLTVFLGKPLVGHSPKKA